MKSKGRGKSYISGKITVYGLSGRELQILNLITEGLTKKEIAENLSLSYHIIDSHLRKVYKKLGLKSKILAIIRAIKEKLIQ